MKLIYSLALGLLLAWSSPAQSFKKAKGGGTDVSISKSGEVFVVGTSKQIFKYYFNIEDFKLHSKANRSAKTIAAAQEKFVYLLTRDGRMHITYANNDSRIGAIGSLALKDIYVGKNNALWGVDTRGAVKRYSSNWQSFSIAGTNNKKVCVNNSGRVFTLKNDNTLYEYHNGTSKKLPGGGTDIAYDHAQNKLYVLGTSKRIFVWNPGRRNWDLVKNTRNDFKSIAAHNGKLWATTTRNSIYTTANIKNTETSSPADYSGRYRVTVNHIYENTNRVPPRPDAEIFGTIGVRVYGYGESGQVEIRALDQKPPRIWSASKSHAQKIKQNMFLEQSEYHLYPRVVHGYWGRYEIGKSREYKIDGELANEKLAVNIQMNLHAKGLLLDEEYPWQTETIDLKNVKLGQVYKIESKIPDHRYKALAVTFKIDKY